MQGVLPQSIRELISDMSHWTFFSFPLNLLLAVLWGTGWFLLWKKNGQGRLVRFLLSPAATISSMVLLLAVCLWMGFSGNDGLTSSVPFALLLLFIQTVLFLVTLRGWKGPGGVIRWRFLFIHAGLLLAIGSAFWGTPDSSESRLKLMRGETSPHAFELDGTRRTLDYEISLTDFKADYAEDGKPVHYEAIITIDGDKSAIVTVNHPYSVRPGEDIYLTSVSQTGCVLQIVREPWRYFALAGIIMLFVGAFMMFIKGPRR